MQSVPITPDVVCSNLDQSEVYNPQTIHNKLTSWQNKLDSDINAIKKMWADGGSTKFQLIGDNWDKNILPSFRLQIGSIYALGVQGKSS
jgi:hypothetical protein